MISKTTSDFWKAYYALPIASQNLAKKAYELFQSNPLHPSLQFKKVNNEPTVYSVRISLSYRALGVKDGDTIIWFWVGNHDSYDRLISGL